MEKNNEAKELVLKDSAEIMAPQDFGAGFDDDMDGLYAGTLNGIFDSIKIPAGGGKAWEIPTDDPENPDIQKSFTGIIVADQMTNSYWTSAYDGSNNPPECNSNDGKHGYTASGECRDCASCPRNQFRNGMGKECKNQASVFILLEGSSRPVKLVVPPSSLGIYKKYRLDLKFKSRKSPDQVVTRFSLQPAKSGQGIEYSKLVLAKDRDVTADDLTDEHLETKQVVINVAAALKASHTAPASEDYAEVNDEEPVPF